MSSNVKTLTWNDRLALMEHFKPTDDQACAIFGVTINELNTARKLEGTMFQKTRNIDYTAYINIFDRKMTKMSATTHSPSVSPETATKPTRAVLKRGRNGSKIASAFAAIPSVPIPLEQYATTHGISLNALRQSSRFDKSPELGRVRVKKNKETIYTEAYTIRLFDEYGQYLGRVRDVARVRQCRR